MIFGKLLLAHILGDFFLQPSGWVENKKEKKWKSPFLYLHGLVHFALILILFWDIQLWNVALLIALTHIFIDGIKNQFQKDRNTSFWFFGDQLFHLSVLFLIWSYFWEMNIEFILEMNLWVLLTGILILTYPSSVIIQRIMNRWTEEIEIESEGSLRGAGEAIGILERLLIFTAIVGGYPQAVGFLLAAKSVFRFGDLTRSKDRKLTEYILVGTLLSFLLAIVTGIIVAGYFTTET
jgi:hypothetical protein